MHVSSCPMAATEHTDAAKRVCDSVNLHQLAGDAGWAWENVRGKWMAFKLEDGSSDGTLYDSKQDAIRHQSDEFLCMYLPLHPGAMNVCEAEIMLKFHRKAYDAGFRLPDPDTVRNRDLMPRIGTQEILTQIRRFGS